MDPESKSELIRDNWIYIQEPDVYLGRLQIFNNWSPYMTADPDQVWLGLEYFCSEGDDLWSLQDDAIQQLAVSEMIKLGFIRESDVIDTTLIRQPKAYPAYFGSYDHFDQIRNYCDGIQNLFLMGRNGMHRYNNQDHSMLTAMEIVSHLKNGYVTRDHIWDVNAEQDYHEETS